jgi:hypothetical protein
VELKMENANKVQHWNNSIASRVGNVRPTWIVGIVLVVILAVLTGFNPFLGITSALVLFLLVLVVPRPILIVYGLVLIIPLTGGLARGAVVPVLRLEQAVVVFAFILFLLARPGPQGKSRLTAIDLAFVLFFLSEAVFPVLALYYRGEHLDLNDTHNIYGTSPLQTLLGPLQYYLLYRIVVATISSDRQIKLVLELSFIASIIVSVIGILERFVAPVKKFIETYYPPLVQDANVTLDQFRITSTLGHFSGLAAYLVFTIILVLACYTVGQRMKISGLLLVITTLFDSIALILTGTFAGWIGLAVGAVAVFILIRRVPKLFILILCGIALAALIFQPFLSVRLNEQLGAGAAQGLVPQSLAFRIMLWENLFLPAIGQNLLFGAGPVPAILNSWSAEESQYLFLLLRGGLPYFFSYLLLIGVAMTTCWRQIKSKSRDVDRSVAIALLVILIILNVMNVSGEYFTYVGGAQVLWMLLAIVVASRQFQALSSMTSVEQILERP